MNERKKERKKENSYLNDSTYKVGYMYCTVPDI
jgi:hypothetical protein